MLVAFCAVSIGQNAEDVVVPIPLSVTMGSGTLSIGDAVSIVENGASTTASYLKEQLSTEFGIAAKRRAKAQILIDVDDAKEFADEGYRMEISSSQIVIEAAEQAGAFYAVQSLLQLMRAGATANGTVLSCQAIEDAPRFGWRSFMLDECRYFLGQEELYKILDAMAELKMNRLHWHLTDDAGWRVEIKQYPLLTEIGGKRADSEIETWGSGKTSGEPHEGFYTQKQIKEVLAYAKERHIKIIPEIEMPGHSSAAVASYSWLGTSGQVIEVPAKFGKLYHIYDVLNPEVIEFLHNVVAEVVDLFETDIIHIGGDEVRFDHWEASERYQEYKEAKGYGSYMDIQIEFTNKMAEYINGLGCEMMGWNEILGKSLHSDLVFEDAETDLSKQTIVHFWKGDPQMLASAAKEGYTLVNSYHVYTYLDYSHEKISLEKAYSFEPIDDLVEQEYHDNIIGLGCQLWREWLPTAADVQRNVFPRIAAYAEVGWSEKSRKDYESFSGRVATLVEKWQSDGINVYTAE